MRYSVKKIDYSKEAPRCPFFGTPWCEKTPEILRSDLRELTAVC